MDPFIESFKTALSLDSGKVLPNVLSALCLNIAFLPNFLDRKLRAGSSTKEQNIPPLQRAIKQLFWEGFTDEFLPVLGTIYLSIAFLPNFS